MTKTKPPFALWEPLGSRRGRPSPTPMFKAAVSAAAILAVSSGHRPKEVSEWMRAELLRQWTMRTALQYLAGKEGRAAIAKMPEGELFRGMRREDMARAAVIAAGCLADMDEAAGRGSSTIHFVNLVRNKAGSPAMTEQLHDAIRAMLTSPQTDLALGGDRFRESAPASDDGGIP